jgi:hypothetical protein
MPDRVPRSSYPFWVKFSIFGLRTRRGMWGFFALSLLLVALAMILAVQDRVLVLFALPFVGSATMYWAAMRWIDRHGSWD